MALKDFPSLQNSLMVTEMLVRDRVVVLYRLPDAAPPMTDFERGALAFAARQPDSAAFYFGRFSADHPASLLGRTHYITALYFDNHRDEALAAADSLIAVYPDNYMLHSFCRGFYQLAYRTTGDQRFSTLADEYRKRALELDPALAEMK